MLRGEYLIQQNLIIDDNKIFFEINGRNFEWQRPNYKMSLGKIMLKIPIFSFFLTSNALDSVVLVLNYFPIQKKLCSVFLPAFLGRPTVIDFAITAPQRLGVLGL